MNKSEEIAKIWLIEQGKKEIEFRSHDTPDFIADGNYYEVKRLYSKCIIFYEEQIKKMQDEHFVIVVDDDRVVLCFQWKDRKKQKYEIKTSEKCGKIIRIDEETYDMLLKENGESWTEKIKNSIKKNNTPHTIKTPLGDISAPIKVIDIEGTYMTMEEFHKIVIKKTKDYLDMNLRAEMESIMKNQRGF